MKWETAKRNFGYPVESQKWSERSRYHSVFRVVEIDNTVVERVCYLILNIGRKP